MHTFTSMYAPRPSQADLLKSLIAAKNVNSGFSYMRQVYLGKLDLVSVSS